jgi:GAF domain-containing protein
MTVHPAYRLLTPIDKDAPRRAARLQELGIREEPDPEFDQFARTLAQELGAPFAMVNIIGPKQQYFAGLYPSSHDRGVDPVTDPFRRMACDHGYCMYVVTRQHAMALDEVMDYHLFAGNPVVDKIGVRAYLGAPLIDRTGTLGTICVLDTKPHDWGTGGVAFIKARAAELVERIHQRVTLLNGSGYTADAASDRKVSDGGHRSR